MAEIPDNIFRAFPAGPVTGTKEFTAAWTAPSNIALIKYWGKKEGQIPANASLSMTLSKAVTHTMMHAGVEQGNPGIAVNDDPGHPFIPKLKHFMQQLSPLLPVLDQLNIRVSTENTFPHSAGIASSASGISAFTLCLLDILQQATGVEMDDHDFRMAASYIARMGSGSASRSIYGGFTVWGANPDVPGSSDRAAVPVTDRVHSSLLGMRDAILIVSSGPKSLSSTIGHSLMDHHPFAAARYAQAAGNLRELLQALAVNDLEKIIQITESEALTLHALIMTSHESGLLLLPQSLELVHRIRKARTRGLPVFFTIDAGPNIHLLYPETAAPEVEKWIDAELKDLCQDGRVIIDKCGEGPVKTG